MENDSSSLEVVVVEADPSNPASLMEVEEVVVEGVEGAV